MICGAVISDNNTDGIGWGCMANVVKPAIKETMWEVYGLDIWVAKANRIKANAFRGVIIAKSYSYKKDIISALNSVPLKIN